MTLNERVVVITGASGGLGRVVSQRLAEAGAYLALISTSADKLAEMERELQLPPERVLTYTADLSQPEAAQKVCQAVMAKFDRVEILLHFVGGWIGGKPLTQVTAEEVSTMLKQHVWTTFYLAQAFVPPLVANGWGRIIVVSSPVVANPPANNAPYTIGKSGQEALILTLAEELKNTGVTANVLRVRNIDIKHERDEALTTKNASWTTPEEIASAIEYLCSSKAHMVNGARLPLYGSP